MARHGVCLVVGQLEIGGLEKQVHLLATGLDPRLFEVTVVSLSGGGVWAGALTRSGVRVLELNRHGHFDLRRFAALRRVFRDLRPDLVYSFNYAGNAYARLAGLLAGVPILITGERDIYMSRSMALLERLLLPFTECVICNAEAIRRDLIDRVGLAGNKVITIPNGVVVPPPPGPEEKEAARRSIGAGVDEIVVDTITRIAAKKNLGMLVRAADLCRTARAPVRFYIVGGGPDEKSLRDAIRERGLEKCITLLGSREDAWTLLPGFDLFVLTSRIEGLPNTVMEAMAAGLPCICTDVGGCRELVEDGVTGYLVPPDDEQALLARIMEMASDPEARAAMGRLAREKIATAHSVERLVFRVQGVFLHLLSSARSRARGRRLSANFVEARESGMRHTLCTDVRTRPASQSTDSAGPGCKPSRMLVSVTVVMPIRNEVAFIRRSLGALLDQDYPMDLMEIVIADGKSQDGTREVVREYMARHRNLRLIDNPGRIVPTGLNRAIRQAKGDVIVRVDGHTVVARDYVSQCVALLRRSGADNVGGAMRPEGQGRFGRAVAAATNSPFGVGDARFHYSEEEEWVDTVYMGAWPRALFDQIGLFDEEMVRDQDDELNYRLLEHGGRILLSPKIRSSYTARGTPRSLWRQYFQYGYWKVRVVQKHPRQVRLRQLAPPVFTAALCGSLFVACVAPQAVLAWGAVPLTYAVACITASITTARRAGWSILLLLPPTFAILHLSYGLGFLFGLARFAARWGGSRASQPSPTTDEGPTA